MLKHAPVILLVYILFFIVGCGVASAPSLDAGGSAKTSATELSNAELLYQQADQAAIPAVLRQPRSGTYPVTMEPAGTWYVDKTPHSYVTFQAIEADTALALGQSDGLVGMFNHKGTSNNH